MIKQTLLLPIAFFAFSLIPCHGQDSRQGKQIRSIVITEEKPEMLVKKQYKESETYYDQKGNIIEEISYKEGRIKTHFKYQYDNENNKIREEEFDSTGKLIETSEYRYSDGLRIEKIVYDASRRIKLKKVYTYTLY